MFDLKKIILLLSFLSTLSVFASETTLIWKISSKSTIKVHLLSDDISSEDLSSLRSIFNDILKVVPVKYYPEDLVVKLRKRDFMVGYKDGIIMIPIQYDTGELNLPDSKYTKTIIAHEFAHAIFDEIMKKNIPEYNEMISRRKSRLRAKVKIDELHEQMIALENNSIENEVSIQILKDEFDKLYEQYRLSIKNITTREKEVFRLREPLNELFADMIAVIWSKDGKAVADSIQNLQMGSEEDVYQRDFTMGQDDELLNITNQYQIYAPFRDLIWRQLSEVVYQEKATKTFIQKSIRIFINRYQQFLSEGSKIIDSQSMIIENEQLHQEFLKIKQTQF